MTLAPERFPGTGATRGRRRYRADLVLPGADPIVDHRALHDIRAVVRDGGLWSREDLDRVLRRLEAAPTAR